MSFSTQAASDRLGYKRSTFSVAFGFHAHDGLTMSEMARRLKINAATISRLLAGNYKGNVDRMCERIEAYRHGVEIR
jgi:DNA-binding MarR family transcriptional regulator